MSAGGITSETVEDMFEDRDILRKDNDIDMDDLTEVSIHSHDSSVSLKTKHNNKSKKADKGYEKKVKIIKNTKIVIDTYETSDVTGAPIRHAATGFILTDVLVGSPGEKLYFKVKDTTGKVSRTLFYDSPEEFERHMFTTLSTEVKHAWTDTFAKTQAHLRSLET